MGGSIGTARREDPMPQSEKNRFCLDSRAGELGFRGLLVPELVDQLVCARSEKEIEIPWMERSRTVLVSHPTQRFAGQLQRFETSRRQGSSFLYGLWEKSLVRRAGLFAFHRFCPVDRLGPAHRCPTITTLLPARSGLPLRLHARANDHYVVPSEGDKRLLIERFGFPRETIQVTMPSARRYFHVNPRTPKTAEPSVVFLCGRSGSSEIRRLRALITGRYPEMAHVSIPVSDDGPFGPVEWAKQLASARLVVYLTHKPFDWGTLALESLQYEVPVVFPDRHSALAELLPDSMLKLSRFLVDMPSAAALKALGMAEKERLFTAGALDPLALAKQYARVFNGIFGPAATDLRDQKAAPDACDCSA